jgi:hypothetical protein
MLWSKWFVEPMINNVIDWYMAQALELYYAPYKAFVNASNLDFVVWPNAKIVGDLYKSNLCRPQTNA